MRFLFVDRILKMEKGRSAEGIKNVSFHAMSILFKKCRTIPYFRERLALKQIAQLISWLVIYTKDFTVKPVAVMTASIRNFMER